MKKVLILLSILTYVNQSLLLAGFIPVKGNAFVEEMTHTSTVENEKIAQEIKRTYHENGKVSVEEPYISGKTNGIAKFYDKKGNLTSEVSYKNGVLEGISKLYDKDGNLNSEVPYKNGKIEGIWTYYDKNSEVSDELLYVNGVKEGICKYRDEKGNLRAESLYKNDKREGITKIYTQQGSLKKELLYKNDKKEGLSKIYDKKGKVSAELTYQNNKLISKSVIKNGKTISKKIFAITLDTEAERITYVKTMKLPLTNAILKNFKEKFADGVWSTYESKNQSIKYYDQAYSDKYGNLTLSISIDFQGNTTKIEKLNILLEFDDKGSDIFASYYVNNDKMLWEVTIREGKKETILNSLIKYKETTTSVKGLWNMILKEEVSGLNLNPINKSSLKILPINEVWAGFINIDTNQKYQKRFKKDFSMDPNKNWLLLFGAGTIKLEVNGEVKKYTSEMNMRFKYINKKFTRITVTEFKRLNNGRKW